MAKPDGGEMCRFSWYCRDIALTLHPVKESVSYAEN